MPSVVKCNRDKKKNVREWKKAEKSMLSKSSPLLSKSSHSSPDSSLMSELLLCVQIEHFPGICPIPAYTPPPPPPPPPTPQAAKGKWMMEQTRYPFPKNHLHLIINTGRGLASAIIIKINQVSRYLVMNFSPRLPPENCPQANLDLRVSCQFKCRGETKEP